jgi:hypothetical protein
MKKYLLFICLSILASCSESESSSTSKIQNDSANFTLTKSIERVDWTNIQVGELLKFDISISDFDTNSNVVYILKPITRSALTHQRNKLDYNFQEEVKIPSDISSNTTDQVNQKETRDSIVIKTSKSSFFLSILKPGNFIHQYELRKMRGNKYVAGSTQEISFSAVKIDVFTRNEQTDNGTMFSSSKHSRYYEFTIDDGDQTNDTYLTDSESKEHTYMALYNGIKYGGTVSIDTPLIFSNKVNTDRSPQKVPNWILSELKIIQKRKGEPDNIIIYNNLNISQK